MTHLLKDVPDIKSYLLSYLMSMVCFAHFSIWHGTEVFENQIIPL